MEIGKVERVLDIYTRLWEGEAIYKAKDAQYYAVSERSIQRDIEDIQIYLEEATRRLDLGACLIYDRGTKSYRMLKTIRE